MVEGIISDTERHNTNQLMEKYGGVNGVVYNTSGRWGADGDASKDFIREILG